MENAPGTYEKSKNQSEMRHQTAEYCIQTPNEPWQPSIPPRSSHWPPRLVVPIRLETWWACMCVLFVLSVRVLSVCVCAYCVCVFSVCVCA